MISTIQKLANFQIFIFYKKLITFVHHTRSFSSLVAVVIFIADDIQSIISIRHVKRSRGLWSFSGLSLIIPWVWHLTRHAWLLALTLSLASEILVFFLLFVGVFKLFLAICIWHILRLIAPWLGLALTVVGLDHLRLLFWQDIGLRHVSSIVKLIIIEVRHVLSLISRLRVVEFIVVIISLINDLWLRQVAPGATG